MKYLRMFAAAMALIALAAGSASATTLEINGVTQTGVVELSTSIVSGKSLIMRDTSGFSQNTCTTSVAKGSTETKTGTAVTGKLSSLTISGCTRTVTIHKPGTLEIVWSDGTTNGTAYSEEAQITSGSPIGTLNCTTGATTHLGTLTGVKEGSAVIHMNALINCGIIASMRWEAVLSVTSPGGLGVVS